jgi:thioredoxin-dependent peroxiredoxin
MKFPFELLSDEDETVCKLFGKKVRGIERSTFLIDEKGVVAREWRGVKVPGHVQEVLSFAKAL